MNSTLQSRVEADGEGASASSPAPSPRAFVVCRNGRYLRELFLMYCQSADVSTSERADLAYRFQTSAEAEAMAQYLSLRFGSDFSSYYLPDLLAERGGA